MNETDRAGPPRKRDPVIDHRTAKHDRRRGLPDRRQFTPRRGKDRLRLRLNWHWLRRPIPQGILIAVVATLLSSIALELIHEAEAATREWWRKYTLDITEQAQGAFYAGDRAKVIKLLDSIAQAQRSMAK